MMGEQELLSFEDESILEKAEREKAEGEKNGKSKKSPAKKRPSKKKESSTPSPENQEGDGEGNQIEESTGVDEQSKPAKSARKPTEPETRPDGWNINTIGVAPKNKSANPYFEGVIALDGLTSEPSLAPFNEINHASRIIYVDDIHLENPTVIDTKFMISGSFYDVCAHVSEDLFEEIRKHPKIKLKSIYYSYVSCDRAPKRRRNYQLINQDRWPTEKEIQDMDKHMDEVDYALMGYSERQRYKEEKQKQGESIEDLDKQENEEAESQMIEEADIEETA